MKQQERVNQLASLVEETLLPLINSDYVLYGLPNYTNVGDLLIWEGALALLKKVPYKCKGVCSWNEYPANDVAGNSIILVLGGGYFGDVWRNAWQYVLEGIRFYRNNRIIILPMSIYYQNETLKKADADYLAGFNDLIICARDDSSFQLAKESFRNTVLLVPDLAWCNDKAKLARWSQTSSDKVLLLKRCDKELVSDKIIIPESNVEVHDWPTIEYQTKSEILFERIIKLLRKIRRKWPWTGSFVKSLIDWLFYVIFRKQMISRGVSFISSYDKIYTTRLHALILSVLLGKEVHIIDNSYGKLSACYETWLRDVEQVYVHEGDVEDGQL